MGRRDAALSSEATDGRVRGAAPASPARRERAIERQRGGASCTGGGTAPSGRPEELWRLRGPSEPERRREDRVALPRSDSAFPAGAAFSRRHARSRAAGATTAPPSPACSTRLGRPWRPVEALASLRERGPRVPALLRRAKGPLPLKEVEREDRSRSARLGPPCASSRPAANGVSSSRRWQPSASTSGRGRSRR